MADKTPKGTVPVKKVAILEIVDKTGKVDYAHKLMLRTSLTKAITEAEGYEGYDRTDLDALLGEQTFQRTGMVTNEQIKRVGELTGAQYVLVAEAVMVDSATIFATSKIIDVETAQTIKAESQLMRATPQDIQIGCTTLAGNMLGVTLKAGITQAATASVTSKPAATTTTTTTTAAAPAPKPKPIIKWGWTDNCSVTVKKCYTSNGKLYLQLSVNNHSGKVFNCSVSWNYISIYDDRGGEYPTQKNVRYMGLKYPGSSQDLDTRFTTEIPDDISKTFTIVCSDFDEDATSIKLCKFQLNSGKWGAMTAYNVEIRNIPVEKK